MNRSSVGRAVDSEHVAAALAVAPFGFDVITHTEVVPKPPPRRNRLRWRLVVEDKATQPASGPPGTPATHREEITVQITADQQVQLTIRAEDAYDNPVDLTDGVTWTSSDESIVALTEVSNNTVTAVAVGPVGSVAVTAAANTTGDEAPDFQGSIAIDVVAGDVAEIIVQAGDPTDKP